MEHDWSLIAGHPPGWLGAILLGMVVLLALIDLIALVRRPPPAARARPRTPNERGRVRPVVLGLLALRLLALASLVAVVLEVELRVQTYSGSARRVVVLVDRSASMAIPDSPDAAKSGTDTTRRWDRLRTLWQSGADAREEWRAAGVDIEVRTFGRETAPLSQASADALELEPDAPASELGRALLELAEADPGQGPPLAAVVVLSDGLVANDAPSRDHLRAVSRSLEVPITTIAAGAPTLRDVALARLHVGEFAFVENLTEFSADLIAHGLAGERAKVTLVRDGEPVAEQTVRLGDDGEAETVRFEVAPDRTGQFVYEFRVAPLEGEASEANNRRAFVVKVLRDKVRVLHVAGRPDWDVRALRTLLKRDPNVELLSYYILRDWEDLGRDDGDAPLSLIAFPTEELFREQLGSFDLIVMHNFDAQNHGEYLGNVADYVAEGGSLVLIGGDLGIATGDFDQPELLELLPIDLRRPVGLEREPFRPRLTDAGRRHPITAWLGESGRADWSDLPPLDSFNPANFSRGADELGTTALLVHPDRATTGGQPAPLLAVAEPGKGRVMVLTTGATWRLGFAPDLPLIDGARPYDLLWLGAVRWLLRDESAERLVLETSKAEHALGEPVELTVRTLSASYAPEPDVEIEWRVGRLDGDPSAGSVAEGQLTTDGLGRASTRLSDLPAGAYEAEAWRADAQRAQRAQQAAAPGEDEPELGAAARRVFLIGAGGAELSDIDADRGTELLRELATSSKGAFVEAVEGDELPSDLPMLDLDQLDRVATGQRDVPVWNGWWMLVLLTGCFGGEWVLRRRLGAR